MSDSLACSRHTTPLAAPKPAGYLTRTAFHPAGVMIFVMSVCMGAWLGGVFGLVAGLFGSLGLIAAAARWPLFRRVVEEHEAERERRRRDMERERRMERAAPLRRAEFVELGTLVAEIEERDPRHAERFELQELLDYYVGLATGHQHLVEALQRADRAPLWEAAAVRPGADLSDTSRHRREILARRLRHRDECRNRAALLAEELDAVAEFIHLVSEVSSCPTADGESQRELERRMWELEAHESALRQLSAA